MKLEMMD